MYALLCRELCEQSPNFDPPSSCAPSLNNHHSSNNTFRRLLLAKCQDEFENRRKATEDFDKKDGPLTVEESEQRSLAKHKMLGNIKFIGELGKQGLLQEAILHQCIQQLLAKKKRQTCKDVAEDLECLCQIMRTVGHRLDTDKARALMDQYFDRMQTVANSNELPSRIRFMLQDVLELRQNKWIPRRVLSDHGPKTIQQIREEASRDYGVYISPMNRSNQSNKSHGGMDDVFASLPLVIFSGNLGTGPGVISSDNFFPYSGNMGRTNRSGMNNSGFLGGGNSGNFYNQSRNNGSQNRDLFPSFQAQRSTSQNNQQSRDLPPRFLKKALPQQPTSVDEISLRPAQNSMVLKPKTPLTYTKASNPAVIPTNLTSSQPVIAKPLIQKEPPIVIKQVIQDKNKTNKQGPTKEEVLKKVDELINNLNDQQNIDDVNNAFKNIRVPKKYFSEVFKEMMTKTLPKSESDRDMVTRIMTYQKKEGHVGVAYLEALKEVFNLMGDLEADVPRVKSFVAGFAARGVSEELISLSELAEALEGGLHYPLFLLTLQQLHKSQGKALLSQTFNASKVNLLNMLPEIDRNKERLADILEDRGLNFLYPLLRIQADLWRQLQTDPSPASLYRWVKDVVDPTQQVIPGFINALVTCIIKYITMETTLAEGVDRNATPDKAAMDRERELLEKFKVVFHAFLHNHPELQLVALYALQVHCHNHSFPKGMLLRWFMLLYDLEVVEEDAFLKWKEDVNDEYPGKGKALFQVNQWLTWLEEAEEEEEECSDEGDN